MHDFRDDYVKEAVLMSARKVRCNSLPSFASKPQRTFRSDIVHDEIALAFGRRAVPKLVDILALKDGVMSDDDLAHTLRMLKGTLSNQETKEDAIACETGWHLARHAQSKHKELQRLSCECLTALAMTMVGRYHVIRAGAVETMIKVLPDCPEGATACLAEIAQGLEGVHAILASQAGVVKAVADIVLHPPTGSVAAQEKGAAMVERVARIDEGIMRALDAHVPAALLRILDRATTGALKGSAGRPARLASLRCLAQMAHHELGRAQILEPLPGQRPSPESSLDVMLRCLELGDLPSLKALTRCLMGITVDVVAKKEVAERCLSKLAAWLQEPQPLIDAGKMDLEALENCRDVVDNCAEQPEVQRRLRNLLEPKTYTELLGKPYPEERTLGK